MRTAEDIMDQVDRLPPDGSLKLAVLTGVDLCVLGALPQPLIEEQIWSWWLGRGEADRAALASRSMARLAEQGLVENGSEPRLTAELGIILAARTRPSFIALRTPAQTREPDGGPLTELRFFGIADEVRGLRAMLVEHKLSDPSKGPVNVGYRYFLCPVAGAAHMLAAWAAELPDRRAWGLRKPTRMIDVYRPGHGAVPDRLEVFYDNHQLTAASSGGETTICSGVTELSQLITEMLSPVQV